jgi:hypothetical protein
VPQAVRRDFLPQSASHQVREDDPRHAPGTDAASSAVQEQCDRIPCPLGCFRAEVTTNIQVRPQSFARLPTNRHDPFLPTLPKHTGRPILEIHIGNIQADQFCNPETRGIE